ncbi:MAG: glycoside hydrolase family 15 protein, partial [Terricaulis sp.]
AHANWWRFIAPFFTRDYRVAALDLSGMGDSGKRPEYNATLRADEMRATIESEAWNADLGRYAATFGGKEMDASLLQMIDTRFLAADDPRFIETLKHLEHELRRGDVVLRYAEKDDFGLPETAFNFCTFWLIEALYLVGRREEARTLFDQMLARRTRAGLLSEDCDLSTGAPWGNYPQTYSLAGLINCAVLLSNPWSSVR